MGLARQKGPATGLLPLPAWVVAGFLSLPSAIASANYLSCVPTAIWALGPLYRASVARTPIAHLQLSTVEFELYVRTSISWLVVRDDSICDFADVCAVH